MAEKSALLQKKKPKSKAKMLTEFEGKKPQIHESAFIHPQSTIIGNVEIGANSSVWPGAILRGDFAKVKIGENTCIQDNAVINPADVYSNKKIEYIPVEIGDNVVIGPKALIHGARVAEECIIGAGSIVFDGAEIEKHSFVGMGAVVLKNTKVSSRTIVVGIPARTLREIEKNEIKHIRRQTENYVKLAKKYKKELNI